MQIITDKALLERIKDDDQSALKSLFDRYYFRLCDFAFQFVRSPDLTEEVVSDVFFKIWKNRSKINIEKNFKAYLYTATRNQALNYNQKERRDWEDLDEAVLPVHGTCPDEELLFKELENRIEILLNMLPPRRKMIFKLSRIEGFTYREIAEILSISVHTVQNQMVQAVKLLGSYSNIVE